MIKIIKVKEDLTGWKMWEHGVPNSRLTVIKQVEDYIKPNGQHIAQWLCECNCKEHKQLNVRSDALKNGRIKSCGCLQIEQARENGLNNKKKNKYTLLKEYGIIWTTNTNEEVYFDLDDAEKILQYSWYKDSEGYVSTHINTIKIRMHTFLGYYYPDHHDKNKLNNRKNNLFTCTPQENARNTPKRIDNKSGVTGVYFNSKSAKWIAQINVEKNKTKNLGSFANKEDAIKVRLQSEATYYGEFAPQKHLFEEYGIDMHIRDGETS